MGMRLKKSRLLNLGTTWGIPSSLLPETGTDRDNALGGSELQPEARRDLLVRSASQCWMLHVVSAGTTSVPVRVRRTPWTVSPNRPEFPADCWNSLRAGLILLSPTKTPVVLAGNGHDGFGAPTSEDNQAVCVGGIAGDY